MDVSQTKFWVSRQYGDDKRKYVCGQTSLNGAWPDLSTIAKTLGKFAVFSSFAIVSLPVIFAPVRSWLTICDFMPFPRADRPLSWRNASGIPWLSTVWSLTRAIRAFSRCDADRVTTVWEKDAPTNYTFTHAAWLTRVAWANMGCRSRCCWCRFLYDQGRRRRGTKK